MAEGIDVRVAQDGTKSYRAHVWSPRETQDLVVAVVRDGESHMFDAATQIKLRKADRVVVVRAGGEPVTP